MSIATTGSVRLLALVSMVGEAPVGTSLEPFYEEGDAKVYAFALPSNALATALGHAKRNSKLVVSVWVGEVDIESPRDHAARAIECARFGDPGQVVLSLGTVETCREHMPEGIRLTELGNRDTGPGLVDRLFVIESLHVRSGSGVLPVGRDMALRFIGRVRELSELENRLGPYRLVTLCGPTGVGKTSLLRRRLDEMDSSGDTWYLDASSLASPTFLAAALNDTFEIRKPPLDTHLETLIAKISEMNGVLGLDCGDRELAAVRSIVKRMLEASPNLAIIVASPRPLGVENECVIPVRGLDYPKRPEGWQLLCEYDAMVFFGSRAAAVIPNFSINAENAETIAMICSRLDGNPAALALAVNKLRTLSPRQILDRLNAPIVFLKGSSNQGLARHQSLHQMIAVTVAPLSDLAKALLGCLSVIEGAVGFDDIEAMFPEYSSLSAFEEIIGAGLLDSVGSGEVVKRFSMAESVRDFSRQTITTEALEDAAARKLAYYEQTALLSEAGLAGRDQGAWTCRMEEQCPDICSSVRTLVRMGEPERACLMLVAGITFWYERNFPSEALALAEEVLKSKSPFPSRARLENFAAVMSNQLGDSKKAEAMARKGLERATNDGDSRFQVSLRVTLSMIAHSKNDSKAATEHIRLGSEIARIMGDEILLYNCLTNYLGAENATEPRERVEQAILEALSLEKPQTPMSWKARLRNNAANAYLIRDDLSHSKTFVREALALLADSGHWVSAAITLRTLAHIFIREGRPRDATLMFGGAAALVEQEQAKLTDYERQLTEKGIKKVTESLGQDLFRELFNEGRLIGHEDIFNIAVDFART